MIAYTIRRLIAAIPVLIAASLLVFTLAANLGDPVKSAFIGRNPPVPRSTIEHEYARLHLKEGFFAQYWRWITGMLHGDFGPSVGNDTTVIGDDLASRLWVTARLVFFAMLIALILAVITGVLSAVRQYSKLDYTFTLLGFVFVSMPAFWIAVLLKQGAIAVNDATGFRFFGTFGQRSSDSAPGIWSSIVDVTGHLVLPTVSLALITYAAWSRFQRASMLEVLNSDYIRLARAKGLSPRKVLIRHGLRTALIPMTTVSALGIAGILGGAVITETVFQWNGMGEYLLNAINNFDRNEITGWLMVTGLIVVLGNLVADLLYGVLDPRIRYE
jgi:peptide/nickel transport system permease protein